MIHIFRSLLFKSNIQKKFEKASDKNLSLKPYGLYSILGKNIELINLNRKLIFMQNTYCINGFRE